VTDPKFEKEHTTRSISSPRERELAGLGSALWERCEARLRDAEIALIAAALLDGLDRGPKFVSDDEIESFLTDENQEKQA